MHHLFLTRCGVYVVVFSLSALSAKERQVEVLDRIFYWLNSIRTHASGAPIFLVGTHADEVATREEHQTLNSVLENYLKRKKTTFKNRQRYIDETSESRSATELSFFPIDNTNPTSPALVQLRAKLEETARADEEQYVQKESQPRGAAYAMS